MQFEWDEAKNLENIRKHRIDFADVPDMFDGSMLVELDERTDYGEDRWIGIGFLRNGVAVVVNLLEYLAWIYSVQLPRGSRLSAWQCNGVRNFTHL